MEDNGTLGWLIEFGLIKQNQRTEQSKQIKEYGSQSHNYILIIRDRWTPVSAVSKNFMSVSMSVVRKNPVSVSASRVRGHGCPCPPISAYNGPN